MSKPSGREDQTAVFSAVETSYDVFVQMFALVFYSGLLLFNLLFSLG